MSTEQVGQRRPTLGQSGSFVSFGFVLQVIEYFPDPRPYSHSIINKPRKASNDAGFVVVIIVNTMKNTMFKIAVDI